MMGSNKDIDAVPLRIVKAPPVPSSGALPVPPADAPSTGPSEWQHLMDRLASARRLKNPRP